MKINDAVFGALLLALGVAVLLIVQGYPKIPGQQVGPGLFPGLIACGLSIGGAALVVRGWRDRARMAWFAAGPWVRSPRHVLALAVVLGGVLFYMFAGERLGFLVCASLLMWALMCALGVPPLRALLIAVVSALVIHFAFYKLLRVPLPWGVLGGIAW